jgi:hypothetical protein
MIFAVDGRVIGHGGRRQCNGGIAGRKVLVVAGTQMDLPADLNAMAR